MAASAALASLLALLAANATSQLDCVCSHIYNETDGGRTLTLYRGFLIFDDAISFGEKQIWFEYCAQVGYSYSLVESCETLERSSPVLAAVGRLVQWTWHYGVPPAGDWDGLSCGGECDCGAGLGALRGLTPDEAENLVCHIADALTDYYSAQGLSDTKWTAETLAANHQNLSQLLHPAQLITRAMDMVKSCMARRNEVWEYSQSELASFLDRYSKYWQGAARLFTHLVKRLSQLFIPLAFEHMGNHTNGQQLRGWIKNMERVRDMLDTKLRGLLHDAQVLSEQIANYTIEENKEERGKYTVRRPLLNEGLLQYQERVLSFRDDFGALCEQQLPQAAQVFGLADALYSFYRDDFTHDWSLGLDNFTDEQWQLEDQSKTTLSVDTGCLQLLADTVDHPRCPLEELPLEAIKCRERLWRDLVERPPRPPVTSYLAYSERAAVSLCLLAWMAANSYGVCQDVPFSILQSVHDARCYFDSPDNPTCIQSNKTDAICYVSRAILLLKCHDFSSIKIPNLCSVYFSENGQQTQYSETNNITRGKDRFKVYGNPTQTTLRYKESLNSRTLKYKEFKVDTLKPLEYLFIGVNILFRLSTASVYMWLPHLGNLPGKILLSFQLTGLVQVLCSEVVYRMAGFPDVSTAALVDSSLTLLGCLWLNTFCYQMYVCVRDLRLPDHLTPAEASMVFRRQMRRALIPWAIVTTACAALEKSNKNYLLHSRITLIAAISSSIALNLFLLGLVAFIYVRNKKSMTRLNIIGGDKGFSKKQLTFMSVNTIILSGICVIIRIGFHQAEGIAQYVYYVHIATMLQGPVLFVFLLCNGKTLPALRNRVLALWRPDVYRPGLELGSAAERNLARRRREPAETAL